MSQKSKRPVNSTGADEIIATLKAINEGKVFKRANSEISVVNIQLQVVVDAWDLISTLFSQRSSIDKFVRATLKVIRYGFKVGNVNLIPWIPERISLAVAKSKRSSPLTQPLLQTLNLVKLQWIFPNLSHNLLINHLVDYQNRRKMWIIKCCILAFNHVLLHVFKAPSESFKH